MDAFDRSLLKLIQDSVPLVREPYAQIAAELGCDERGVLERIEALRKAALVREISALFDAEALGYAQLLVAMRVEARRLDAAGQTAAGHPGVSHCYGREGPFNLWLTLACSPASTLGPLRTAELLAKLCGAERHMTLPVLRRYKLHVRFPAGKSPPAAPPKRPATAALSDEQRRAVRALQANLPTRADPFAEIAAAAGLDADMLLVHAADFLAAGWMRRYAAVLHHHPAGARANLLAAWEVSDAAADAAAAKCTLLPAVSHCFLRPARGDWPYNLYTMIHGRSREDCQIVLQTIAATTSMSRRAELWTLKEYKKARIRLFDEGEAQWEARFGGDRGLT